MKQNTVQTGSVSNVVSYSKDGLHLDVGHYITASGTHDYEVNLTVNDELVICDVRPSLKLALQLYIDWCDSEEGVRFFMRH